MAACASRRGASAAANLRRGSPPGNLERRRVVGARGRRSGTGRGICRLHGTLRESFSLGVARWLAANIQALDRQNQPIVCHFIRMLFCEGGQGGVCRITLMSDMCRKNPAMGTQRTFSAHSVCMLNYLMGVEMIIARLFWTVRVIQDYGIKPHLVLAESLPRLFEKGRSIRTVEDSAAVGFDRIQHRSHPRCMVGGKGHHRIRPDHKGLQGPDLVHLEVKTLLCFR